jgi:hypothetical protein
MVRRRTGGGGRGRLGAGCLAAALLVLIGVAGARAQEAPAEGQPAAAPPESELPDTWYAQALAYSEAGINVTHFWSKGSNKLRAETVIAGHPVVTIVNGPTYYAYDLLSRAGVAIARSPTAIEQDATRGRPFGQEVVAIERLGGERIGEEELGGRIVQVYQVTDALGKRQAWVSNDPRRLTIRLKLFRRATGQTLHTDFLNWAQGLPISDSFFEPEPGVKLLELSFEKYVEMQANREPIGPVPVLYTDLLHGY